jgi:hypothetical protein
VGQYKLVSVKPQLLETSRFETFNLSIENKPVSSLIFQNQLVPLQHEASAEGDDQV